MSKKMVRAMKSGLAYLLVAVMVLSTVVSSDFASISAQATEEITVNEAGGYAEGAYVEWAPVEGASGYMVSVTKMDTSATEVLDDELIRKYPTYWRADALGLAAGTYTLKVDAYDSNGSLVATKTTDTLTVYAHDRSGFAWVNANACATASGAYNENGTLRAGALVLYVTNANQNTIKANITTSSGGATTACTGIMEIMNALKKGYEKRPVNIRIIGSVEEASGLDEAKEYKGDWCIETGSTSYGITIEGVGNDATANGWGIRLKNAANVEIRNIGFMNCDSGEGDCVGLQQNNHHIWVHNCDFFYGQAGSEADQVKGDGSLDCKASTYVTFAYNHFWDSGKCNLLGLKAESTTGYYITYHHNWYDHSDSRHPRVRYYSAHVYNNYYDGNSKYGAGATSGSSVFMDRNYFRNCKYPMMISMQGSDVYAGGTKYEAAKNGTFSGECGGVIKAYNNIMVGDYTYIPYNASTYWLKGVETTYNLAGTNATLDFDAYEVSVATEQVPNTVKVNMGASLTNNATLGKGSAGNTYNNFDTSAEMYSYTADAPEDVPTIVKAKAGRVEGGDFQYSFDGKTYTQEGKTVDADASHVVDQTLKDSLMAYQSKLVAVGGIAGVSVVVKYTVKFQPNNQIGTETSVIVEAGQTVSQPADPAVPEGYESFAGWYNGNTKWDFSQPVTGSMTLTAKYLKAGSTEPGSGGEEGGDFVLSDYVHNFTKNGLSSNVYEFVGNTSESKGTVTYNNQNLTKCLKMESSTSITFRAPKAGTLKLVFGGTTDASGKKVQVNGTAYTCDTSGIAMVTISAAGEVTISKGDSIYLFYIEYIFETSGGGTTDEGDKVKFTVTFDSEGGSAVASQEINKGEKVTEPTAPTRDGFTFKGWCTDADCTIAYDFNTAVTADITLYAKWEAVDGGTGGEGGNSGTQDGGNGGEGGNGGPGEKDNGVGIAIVGLEASYPYTGAKIVPNIGVADFDISGGKMLAPGVDYTVSYKNNTKVGVATVIVTGKGNYVGKDTLKTFEIKAAGQLASEQLVNVKGAKIAKIAPVTYTGNAIYPNITVTLKGGVATEYSYNVASGTYVDAEGKVLGANVAFSNNVNKGTATILLTGAISGKKASTVKATFKINAVDLSTKKLDITADSGVYTVKGATPGALTVKCEGKTLRNGIDYTVKYSANKKAGTAQAVITGKGNYAKKAPAVTYTVAQLNLAENEVSAVKAVSGMKAGKVTATVLDKDGNALKASQYTVHVYKEDGTEYAATDVLAAGTVIAVKAVAKDVINLQGETPAASFTVGTDFTKAKAGVRKGIVKQYTGAAITLDEADLIVSYKGASLELGKDFEIVAYSNNVNKGTATVILRGINAYSGTKTVKFKIVGKTMQLREQKSEWEDVSDIANFFKNLLK